MKRLGALVAAAVLLGGCTAQEQSQQRLIGSMQSGLRDLAAAQEERQVLIDGFYAQRRRMLDDAFDEDVRTAASLDANWVIEHRKAYMLGCEAIWRQQQASMRAQEQMQRNLRTIGEGLGALAEVSKARQQWGGVIEGKEADRGQH